MSNIIYIVLAVILVLIVVTLLMFNRLVRLYNRVKKAKSNIEIYLNKRFDLIPNLVECVKSYSKYEDGTLEKIVSLRSDYSKLNNLKVEDVSEMDNKLNKYLAVVEAYPDLKANTEYLNLQEQLRDIENQLSLARQRYNDIATNYNVATEVVPSNLVSSIFGFKKVPLFSLEDNKKENIEVKM